MYHVKRPNVPKMKAPNTHIGVSLYYSFSQSLIDEAINAFLQVGWRAAPSGARPPFHAITSVPGPRGSTGGRGLGPQATLVQEVAQEDGAVGDDAVDADLEEA